MERALFNLILILSAVYVLADEFIPRAGQKKHLSALGNLILSGVT